MTTLDRPLYREGTEIRVGVMLNRQRDTVSCRYVRPVGHGGLHYVTDLSTGDTLSVPIEDIGHPS